MPPEVRSTRKFGWWKNAKEADDDELQTDRELTRLLAR
jgi:hypothetical protein